MGGKDRALNAFQGVLWIWERIFETTEMYILYSVGVSLTFLNIKFFVAKLCESGGQPRPANWKNNYKTEKWVENKFRKKFQALLTRFSS